MIAVDDRTLARLFAAWASRPTGARGQPREMLIVLMLALMPGLSHRELARYTGAAEPTVRRVVASLRRRGLVESQPAKVRKRGGPLVHRLAPTLRSMLSPEAEDLAAVIEAALRAHAEQIDERTTVEAEQLANLLADLTGAPVGPSGGCPLLRQWAATMQGLITAGRHPAVLEALVVHASSNDRWIGQIARPEGDAAFVDLMPEILQDWRARRRARASFLTE